MVCYRLKIILVRQWLSMSFTENLTKYHFLYSTNKLNRSTCISSQANHELGQVIPNIPSTKHAHTGA